MTCREFADFIADFLDNALPAAERQRFERHLSVCPNCVRYLDGYQQSIALGKGAFDDAEAPVPGDVPEDLVQAILTSRRDGR